MHIETDATKHLSRAAGAARVAARALARSPGSQRDAALRAMAAALHRDAEAIVAANAADLADSTGSAAFRDRLALNPTRIAAMASGLEAIAALPDPLARTLAEWTRPNGLRIQRIATPIGVIGMIYESRPNVGADAAGLCLKSGNAVILRGGSESLRTARAINAALVAGLRAAGLPEAAVQIAPTADRAYVAAMLGAAGLVDLIIPRGGKSLVERVQREARVPILAHAEGLCHTYVHTAADPAMARRIVANAKMRRTGICGATETLLIDAAIAPDLLPDVIGDLRALGCDFRADAGARAIVPDLPAATDGGLRYRMAGRGASVRVVEGLDQALAHIAEHGSEHTDAIITEDAAAAEQFLRGIDGAVGDVERLHPVLRWRRVRVWRGNRDRDGTPPCARAGRAGAVDDLSVSRARQRPGAPLSCRPRARDPLPRFGDRRRMRIGLLGGSFNPAHAGHRHIAQLALRRLRLDQVWLMVSPGNVLKPRAGMAPFERRLASAAALADGRRLLATGIEATLGTRYSIDTLHALIRLFPAGRLRVDHGCRYPGAISPLAALARDRRARAAGDRPSRRAERERARRSCGARLAHRAAARPGGSGARRRGAAMLGVPVRRTPPRLGHRDQGQGEEGNAARRLVIAKPATPAPRKRAVRKAPKPLPAADKTPGTPRKKAAVAGPRRTGVRKPAVAAPSDQLDRLQGMIVTSLDDDKAEAVVTLDLAGKAAFCDRMVIATGLADRQITAMAEHLVEKLHEVGLKRVQVEGATGSDWVLIDAGDIVVHLFKPEARTMYALEKMWGADLDEGA